MGEYGALLGATGARMEDPQPGTHCDRDGKSARNHNCGTRAESARGGFERLPIDETCFFLKKLCLYF